MSLSRFPLENFKDSVIYIYIQIIAKPVFRPDEKEDASVYAIERPDNVEGEGAREGKERVEGGKGGKEREERGRGEGGKEGTSAATGKKPPPLVSRY